MVYRGLDSRFIALRLAYFRLRFCRDLKNRFASSPPLFHRREPASDQMEHEKALESVVQSPKSTQANVKERTRNRAVYERLAGGEASFNGNRL